VVPVVGKKGGYVVTTGIPEEVAQVEGVGGVWGEV